VQCTGSGAVEAERPPMAANAPSHRPPLQPRSGFSEGMLYIRCSAQLLTAAGGHHRRRPTRPRPRSLLPATPVPATSVRVINRDSGSGGAACAAVPPLRSTGRARAYARDRRWSVRRPGLSPRYPRRRRLNVTKEPTTSRRSSVLPPCMSGTGMPSRAPRPASHRPLLLPS